MTVTPPPRRIWYPIEQRFPGFWRRFINAANGAIATSGVPQTVTSWWRSEGDNSRVGGHPESQHILGMAFDIGGPNRDAAVNPMRQAGFVVVTEPTHIHVQALNAGDASRFGLFDLVGIG